MKPRRSKRLSKSPAFKGNEDSDGDIKGKKPKVERLNSSLSNVDDGYEQHSSKSSFDNQSLTSTLNGNESDSSDSSIDYMKAPETLDLNSDFFNVDFKKKECLPSFNENIITSKRKGLSDSEGSSREDCSNVQEYIPIPSVFTHLTDVENTKRNKVEIKQKSVDRRIKSPPKSSKKLHSSSKKKIKSCPVNCKSKNENFKDLNISELLALGESQPANVLKNEKPPSASEEELTDWEEVRGEEGREVKQQSHSFPEGGVQITVDSPDLYHKRKEKGFDWAAFVKRKINQAKREKQILIHKVHLLCFIAHGMYVNSILNSQELMGLSLSLIPSTHCYPDKVDKVYLKNICTWFHKTVCVVENSTEKHAAPSLLLSLQHQFENGLAQSHRDLVFMFVCLLRSLGVSTRLIISLQPLPLKQIDSELLDVNQKKRKSEKKTKGGKKVERKVLSPEEARKLNKKVLSKEEAILLLQSSKANEKDKITKSKTSKVEKVVESHREQENMKRSFRPRKSMENKYKDVSSSSDEYHEQKPNLEFVSEKEEKKKPRRPGRAQNNVSSNNSEEKRKASQGKNIDPDCSKSIVSRNSKEARSLRNVLNMKNKEISDIEESKAKETLPLTKKLSELKNKCIKKEHSGKVRTKEETFSIKIESKDSKFVSPGTSGEVTSPLKKKVQSINSVMTSEDEFEPNNCNKKKEIRKSHEERQNGMKKSPTKESESDSDFEPNHSIIKHTKARNNVKKNLDRRVLSSDSNDYEEKDKQYKNDFWLEVFTDDKKWIPVDVITAEVDCASKLYKRATKPVTYVVAWNPDLTLKDVTRRYCTQFHSVTRKQRVDENWWKETLFPFLTSNTSCDKMEDVEMQRQIQDLPLPTSIAEYKNHPLYALKRHLLKFEAIYPPDAPTLGFVKSEPVYARQCVYTLHSREIWLKDAKVVKLGEQPYKTVKARPKWDRMSGKVITDLPLEIFGPWQVEDYVPPTAVDGKVPRNAYGNVELFKSSMLPKGTVHLQVPALNRVAKKLQIDCAPAVVGFDYHCGACHPTYDGFVVCEEFQDILLDAWNRDQEEAERREQEKRDKRVFGNWRRLIKGLLIRERLKAKYDFGEPAASTSKSKKGQKKK